MPLPAVSNSGAHAACLLRAAVCWVCGGACVFAFVFVAYQSIQLCICVYVRRFVGPGISPVAPVALQELARMLLEVRCSTLTINSKHAVD